MEHGEKWLIFKRICQETVKIYVLFIDFCTGHAACRKTSFLVWVWDAPVPLGCLDLLSWTFFLQVPLRNKQKAKDIWRFSCVLHDFCSAQWFPVPVCALVFLFPPHLLLVNILIDTANKCQKPNPHNRKSLLEIGRKPQPDRKTILLCRCACLFRARSVAHRVLKKAHQSNNNN